MSSKEMSAFERRKLYWKNMSVVGKTGGSKQPAAQKSAPAASSVIANKEEGPRKIAAARRTTTSLVAANRPPKVPPTGGAGAAPTLKPAAKRTSNLPNVSRPNPPLNVQKKRRLESVDEMPSKKFKAPVPVVDRRATVSTFSLAAKPRLPIVTRPRFSDARVLLKTKIEKTPQPPQLPQKRKRNYHHVASRVESGLKRRATQAPLKQPITPICTAAPAKCNTEKPDFVLDSWASSSTPKSVVQRRSTFELAVPSPLVFNKTAEATASATPKLIRQESFTISTNEYNAAKDVPSVPTEDVLKTEAIEQHAVESTECAVGTSTRKSKRSARKVVDKPNDAECTNDKTANKKPPKDDAVKVEVARGTRASTRSSKIVESIRKADMSSSEQTESKTSCEQVEEVDSKRPKRTPKSKLSKVDTEDSIVDDNKTSCEQVEEFASKSPKRTSKSKLSTVDTEDSMGNKDKTGFEIFEDVASKPTRHTPKSNVDTKDSIVGDNKTSYEQVEDVTSKRSKRTFKSKMSKVDTEVRFDRKVEADSCTSFPSESPKLSQSGVINQNEMQHDVEIVTSKSTLNGKQNRSSMPYRKNVTIGNKTGVSDYAKENDDVFPIHHLKTPKSALRKPAATPKSSIRKSLAPVAGNQENVPPVGSEMQDVAKSGKVRPKRAKSVSFQVSFDDSRVPVSLPKTPKAELSLRQKLEHFIEAKGYSASKHRHLRCFGFALSDLKQKSRQSFARDPSVSLQGSSPGLKDRRSVSKTQSVLATDMGMEEKISGILSDMKFLLLKGQPVDESEEWLGELEKHARGLVEKQALYWVVKALLAEQAGQYHQALNILTEAVEQNIQPTAELKEALEEFMERVSSMANEENPSESKVPADKTALTESLLDTGKKRGRKSGKGSSRKSNAPQESFKEMFESTVTKYTMQDSSTIKNLNVLLSQGSSPKVLALLTPVRRSTRVTRSAGPKNRRSFALEDLPSPIQDQVMNA